MTGEDSLESAVEMVKKGADDYISKSDNFILQVKEKLHNLQLYNLNQEYPFVLVFAGPSAVGKTTLAKKTVKNLKKMGIPVKYIGNIKTGEPRKNEIKSGKDSYISEKDADKLEKDPDYTMYKHLGRRYFSKEDRKSVV